MAPITKKNLLIRNRRGVALLITLSIITVLVAVTLELNRRVRESVVASRTARDRLTLRAMTTSAIHAGMALLIRDKETTTLDSIQEDWADPEKTAELLMDLPFEEGTLNISIQDELGKIQVNALVRFPDGRQFNEVQREMWEHFLNLAIASDARTDDTTPAAIINSVKDWLDDNDDDAITGLSGAESDYYEYLDPPYACRNGPIDHLGELVLIKGITEDLFEGAGGLPGIENYMTVYGMAPYPEDKFTFKGAININTADMPVIAAMLPPEHEQLAQSIFEYRQEKSDDHYIHELTNQGWYRSAPGCSEVEIKAALITNASDIFSIEARAALNETRMTAVAVVQREKDEKTGRFVCKALSWHEK